MIMGDNHAFVFIKPHAVTDKTKDLVLSQLEQRGMKITGQGALTAEEIDERQLIDNHYYAIASKATILKPNELNVPNDKFEAQFGLSWQAALDGGRVFNALDGCAELGVDADQMDGLWAKCKGDKKMVKLGGGFYCGFIEVDGKEPCYIFNGFFMSMRSKFTTPGGSIHYYTVEWDAATLSWADFRGKVLGPTDPADAPADSLRGLIMATWEELGLKEVPNTGDNGVHASASPFEALSERMNWLSSSMESDAFGSALLGAGMSGDRIRAWSTDPQVVLEDGKGSIFDALEDKDADDCIATCLKIVQAN